MSVPEQVLKNLNTLLEEDICKTNAEYYSSVIYAITAVSREFAKKPIKDERIRSGMGYEYHDWICPTCKSFLAYEPAFSKIKEICPHCGQRLFLDNLENCENGNT